MDLHWLSTLTLGTRLSLACAALSATLVIVVVSLATATSPRNSLIDEGGAIIADQLAQSATEYIIEKDSLALQALLSELTKKPLIAYANIEDASHQIVVESGPRQLHRGTMRPFTSSVQLQDSLIGYANIHVAGAASPAMSTMMVLLLGATVFALVFVLAQSWLRGLDQALQLLARRINAAVAGSDKDTRAITVSSIQTMCNTIEQLTPPPPGKVADKRAVLALRLPELARDALPPEQLGPITSAVQAFAHDGRAAISERGDGWLLLFTSGDDTAVRILNCARELQQMLADNIDYAMAIDMEAETAAQCDSQLQGFHWQRLCDNAYQMAAGRNSIMLGRLALCDNSVNQQVTVQQDDAEHYRVTGFRDETAAQGDMDEVAKVTVQPVSNAKQLMVVPSALSH